MTTGAVEVLIARLRGAAEVAEKYGDGGDPALWREAIAALTAAEQKLLDEWDLVSRIQSAIDTRLSDAPTREAAIFDRIAVIKRESLSRYGSDSQIRKDWKAILAKAESDLAAAEQARDKAIRERDALKAAVAPLGPATIGLAESAIELLDAMAEEVPPEDRDAFDALKQQITSGCEAIQKAMAAALRQSHPPTEPT
jgi:hypothetical protein